MRRGKNSKCAVVAQSVERFLGKEEVRQFKSAQQLQQAKRDFSLGVSFCLSKVFKRDLLPPYSQVRVLGRLDFFRRDIAETRADKSRRRNSPPAVFVGHLKYTITIREI